MKTKSTWQVQILVSYRGIGVSFKAGEKVPVSKDNGGPFVVGVSRLVEVIKYGQRVVFSAHEVAPCGIS